MGGVLSGHAGGIALLTLLVLTAGCSGLIGGGDVEVAGNTTTDPGGPVTDPGDTTDDSRNPVVSDRYEFRSGESYTYSLTDEDGSEPLRWTVDSVSGHNVTVTLTVATSEGNRSATLTAPQDRIIDLAGENRQSASWLAAHVPLRVAKGRELRVGNTWTVDGDSVNTSGWIEPGFETATVEVTDSTAVAGVDCYEMKIRPADTATVTTACLRADWPFALSLTSTDSGQTFSVIDYDRP